MTEDDTYYRLMRPNFEDALVIWRAWKGPYKVSETNMFWRRLGWTHEEFFTEYDRRLDMKV
jgi:hypothetical protein